MILKSSVNIVDPMEHICWYIITQFFDDVVVFRGNLITDLDTTHSE